MSEELSNTERTDIFIALYFYRDKVKEMKNLKDDYRASRILEIQSLIEKVLRGINTNEKSKLQNT